MIEMILKRDGRKVDLPDLTATEIHQIVGRLRSMLRKTRAGGRPRSTERCPCGAMTAARAAARNHQCQPSAIA